MKFCWIKGRLLARRSASPTSPAPRVFSASDSSGLVHRLLNPGTSARPARVEFIAIGSLVVAGLGWGAYQYFGRNELPFSDEMGPVFFAAVLRAVVVRAVVLRVVVFLAAALRAGAFFAAVLRAEVGSLARRVPTHEMPDFVFRTLALFDPALRSVVPGLGRKNRHTPEKARRVLGWKSSVTYDVGVPMTVKWYQEQLARKAGEAVPNVVAAKIKAAEMLSA